MYYIPTPPLQPLASYVACTAAAYSHIVIAACMHIVFNLSTEYSTLTYLWPLCFGFCLTLILNINRIAILYRTDIYIYILIFGLLGHSRTRTFVFNLSKEYSTLTHRLLGFLLITYVRLQLMYQWSTVHLPIGF